MALVPWLCFLPWGSLRSLASVSPGCSQYVEDQAGFGCLQATSGHPGLNTRGLIHGQVHGQVQTFRLLQLVARKEMEIRQSKGTPYTLFLQQSDTSYRLIGMQPEP